MKITETQLKRLIQESLQELQLEALEEEIVAEQAEDAADDEGDESLDEAIEETWGGARSGASATRGIGGQGGGGDRGAGQLAFMAQRDAKKKAAAAHASQVASDEESMKKNPFKPTKTGMGRAMGLAEARKLIAKLVQEVLEEGAAKPKKPATDPKKKPAPKKK